ncbi:MAG: sugar phosphate isomerase/epimerase, partial [bacterium]
MFRLGYNTNGLAHHRLDEALTLLANIGYEAVAVTPDVGQLDPYRLRQDEASSLHRQADDLGLDLTLETGARFLLDPMAKHSPNLMNGNASGRARRVDYYRRCIDLAV